MINNHALLKSDYPKVVQRQYMRPKLPRSIVNPNLTWQFQIRHIASNNKTDSQAQSSSYQSIMMGAHHPGAISKERLRTEADLTPTEGNVVLLEYVEERPPVQLSKGMCSKIINYYRGDKTRCPVSAGGGDRPARRKRGTDTAVDRESSNANKNNNERLSRLEGPNLQTSVLDWVGKLPKKTQTDKAEAEAIDVLPEGVTEILHPKVHGPFIGPVEEGETVTGLICNLFVAPMFRHEPESTDFLMILTPPGGASRPGQRDAMGVILRDLPSSVYTVGQTEPRTRVNAPNTQGEKNFLGQFISYQIARTLNRAFSRNGDGLRYDEIDARVLPSLDLPKGALRQRLKQVAVYEDSIWTPKKIGFEDYPGVDALGKQISPESIAAFESGVAASRRLMDLGIQQLLEKGSHTVSSVGATMVYLAGQLNAARELAKKMKKLGDISKTNKSANAMQIKLYEKASEELDTMFKSLRQRHEIAQFIYEELQLAPWHLTGEFIDVHKKGEGSGMMKLTGLGDPSGRGEGFNFIRETETKAGKSTGGALNADIKKITGTEADLRKMTMKQMAALLRSYNMPQKKIDTLKRWDRVHVIRELSTRAASDGIGDGL
jgi:transcription initiation factor TFIID subunit 1